MEDFICCSDPKSSTIILMILTITDLSLFSLLSANYWRDICIALYLNTQLREILFLMLNGDLPPERQPSQRNCQPFMTSLIFLEYGTDVCLTFFDFRKAFDNVSHLPLLNKLKDMELEQHVLQWLTSCLSDRQQYVVVDSQYNF